MKFNKIASSALQLEPKERAELAGALWDSLEDPYLSPEELSDEAAIQLALQRSAEIERGEVKPVSHTEMMQRLRKDANRVAPEDIE
jgi:putative addiction module component (TIGR02574 family)